MSFTTRAFFALALLAPLTGLADKLSSYKAGTEVLQKKWSKRPPMSEEVMKDYKVHFELDAAANKVYRETFGIDVPAYNGEGRLDLPVPGTIVIGQDKASFADKDYKNRMEPTEIMKALEGLK